MVKDNDGSRRSKKQLYAGIAIAMVVVGVVLFQHSASSSTVEAAAAVASDIKSAGAAVSPNLRTQEEQGMSVKAQPENVMDQLKQQKNDEQAKPAANQNAIAVDDVSQPATSDEQSEPSNAAAPSPAVEAEPDDYDTSCCADEPHDALPSTWRRYCHEGNCLRVCKPWIDDGFFFMGKSKMTWMNEIHKRGAPVLEKAMDPRMTASNLETSYKPMNYLSPSDCIRYCGVACQSKKDKLLKFASEFCTCGEFPDTYFQVNPMFDDYTKVNNKGGVPDPEGNAMKAVVRPNESQPRC